MDHRPALKLAFDLLDFPSQVRFFRKAPMPIDVVVLLRIAAASVESTRSLLRSVRALQAQAALQQAGAANGTAALTMSAIDAEMSRLLSVLRVSAV